MVTSSTLLNQEEDDGDKKGKTNNDTNNHDESGGSEPCMHTLSTIVNDLTHTTMTLILTRPVLICALRASEADCGTGDIHVRPRFTLSASAAALIGRLLTSRAHST